MIKIYKFGIKNELIFKKPILYKILKLTQK